MNYSLSGRIYNLWKKQNEPTKKIPANTEYVKGEKITLFIWFQNVIKDVCDLLDHWKKDSNYYSIKI